MFRSIIILFFVFSLIILSNEKNYNDEIDKIYKHLDINDLESKRHISNLHFIENVGQWPDSILFKANCKNYIVWVSRDGFYCEYAVELDDKYYSKFSKFELVNSKIPKVGNSKKIKSISKFLQNNSYELLNANNYSEIVLNGIYEGIDIKYYFESGNFRYDFIVHPKANPKKIKFKYVGEDNLTLANNSVLIKSINDTIELKDLVSYQDTKKIKSDFQIDNDYISINIGKYNTDEKLIIDPMLLINNTALIHGTSNIEYVRDLKIDKNGDIYFIGNINSSNFDFWTHGTYKPNIMYPTDLIIGKCDKDFNVDWTFYFGGSGNDGTGMTYVNDNHYQISEKIAIDTNYIYITGKTNSIPGFQSQWATNFPITDNYLYFNDAGNGGTSFFSVFDLNCDSIKYSTYLGNEYAANYVYGSGIDVTKSGKVYLIGNKDTSKSNTIQQELNPITTQNHTGSIYKSFIIGLSPSTSNGMLDFNKIFISNFGGKLGNFVRDIDVDGNTEEIYITGRTKSTALDFGITNGAYDTINPLWYYTNFVTKLHYDSTQSELIIDYNTFFGNNYQFSSTEGNIGSGLKSGSHSVLYKNGLIYFAGDNILDSVVNGVNIGGIPTRNAFDSIKSNSRYEGFLAVIKPDGNGDSDLIYSSYFGGSNISKIFDLAYIDDCDKISFVGYTESELSGYNGFLNNTYQNPSDIMIGIVDIYENGVNSLTDLAYIDSLETNYCYALQHSITEHSIYTVGTDNSNKDMGFYKVEIDTCLKTCWCNPNNPIGQFDNYIFTPPSSCEDSLCFAFYNIDFSNATIPNDISCFKFFKYKIYLENVLVSNYNIDTILRTNLFLDTFCFEKGKILRSELFLYYDENDPSPCIYRDSIWCEPDCRFDVDDYLTYDYNEDGDFCITVSEIPDSLFPYSNLPKGFKFIDTDNNDTLYLDEIDTLDISFPIEFCIDRCDLMNMWANDQDSLLINLKFFGDEGEQITNLGCEDINLNIPLNFICNSFSTSITLVEDDECCVYNIDLIIDDCVENDSIATQIYNILKNNLKFKSYVDFNFMPLNTQANYMFDDINKRISFTSMICDPSETLASFFKFKLDFLGESCESDPIDYPVCKCDCPENIDSWVTLASNAKEAPCASDECHVTGEFDISIPSIINCYTKFNVNDSTMHPIINSNGNIPSTHFDDCIKQGTEKEYTFKFYKDEYDTIPCEVTKSVECTYEDFISPCVPDCIEEKWDIRYLDSVDLPGCFGCKLNIKYATRINTCLDSTTQDIQILSYSSFAVGPDSLACQNCMLSASEIYKQALLKIIYVNEMGFFPITSNDPCNTTWRVVNYSCWISKIFQDPTNDRHILSLKLPCDDNECCSMGLRVCRYNIPQPEFITVDTIGVVNGGDSCSNYNQTIWIAELQEYDTLQCYNRCDYLTNINSNHYVGKLIFNIKSELPINGDKSEININCYQNDELLNLEFNSEIESELLKISVYNLNGQIIKSNDYKLLKGKSQIHLHTNEFRNGMYLINIQVDNRYLTSKKIIINR